MISKGSRSFIKVYKITKLLLAFIDNDKRSDSLNSDVNYSYQKFSSAIRRINKEYVKYKNYKVRSARIVPVCEYCNSMRCFT